MNLIKLLDAHEVMIGITALLLLLSSAVIFGNLAVKLKMPRVIGEITGGIVLGPSVLGGLFPQAYNAVFFGFAGEGNALSLIYWLGLILLMFSSGYEANVNDAASDKKIILWLFAGATVLPLIGGFYLSKGYFQKVYIGEVGSELAFALVFAIAVSITSLPVISKIFMDLGLLNHRFAKIVLSAAAIQDLILWVLLSVAQSIAGSGRLIISDILFHVAATILVFVFAMVIVPRIKVFETSKLYHFVSSDTLAIFVALLFVAILSLIDINVMYSAFVAGMVFKRLRSPTTEQAMVRLKAVSTSFFVPIYFAIVGIRIAVGSNFSIGVFVLFVIFASLLELAGCVIAMKIIKMDWRSSLNLGIAMNARGGPGIVLASVTYELGIINYEFFCALIFLVMISSAVAGYWIEYSHKAGRLLNGSIAE